ncbi:protein phosphatase 2C, putative [Trichomonas vaginalis G3]|uniref:Protein phosphatase 2C, putative n=1 Tax=Trichomonas vaginalis (strain ATCC PRA-98 / G3) TaxID=412133 RepID=A2EP81_TRIV3|nr:cAMP biosynthetic process [Trichomonas vaginalis G3]EAY05548.1 protein phosphatase 2C, putative [Trichomonas vaginalis G3]KAI5549107.1 cAMP biosynthetic process [Trichomonas vaginalis G3]|eukprot:XP_001317771.1 protein phosphatase 2C [Trichomonas vaginalis G3]
MSSKAIFNPSNSFVLSDLPNDITESKVMDIYGDSKPKLVKLLYLTPQIFTNRAVLVHENMDKANDFSARYLGPHTAGTDYTLYYSIQPFNYSDDPPPGEIPTRQQIDDDGANQSPFLPGNCIKDWLKLESIPNLPKVTKFMWLRFNRIVRLDKAFERVTNLNLKGNELEEIAPGITFPVMRVCNLSLNKLKHFTNFQTFCPKIEDLNLSYNQLIDIDPSIADATTLENLDLSHNQIEELPKLPPSLTKLFAHFNKITKCDTSVIPKFEEVTIWDNLLTEIPEYLRGHVGNCTIAHNRLTSFDASWTIYGITMLDISSMELESINGDIFKLPKLNQLILFNNKLKSLPQELTYNTSLLFLDISQNPFDPEEIPQIPFQLQYFRCNFCGIEELSDIIPNPNCLQSLHAIGNELYNLPVLPEITELIVAKNNLMDLPLINANVLVPVTIDASHNQISSIIPYASPFITLDLSYNNLTSIPPSLFQFKSHIKLTGNQISQVFNKDSIGSLTGLDIFRTNSSFEGSTTPISIFELVTRLENDSQVANDTKHLFFSGENIGYSEMIGRRPNMEDAIVIRENFREKLHIAAVFDGHSGHSVARSCAASLPDLLRNDETINSDAIKKHLDHINHVLLSSNDLAGSTMQFAIIDMNNNHLTIMQLGDSRSVVYKNDGRVTFYTQEMRPERRSELARLREDRIRLKRLRTGGMLACSTSIGDFQVKGISHEPEVIEMDISDDDRWIVIACDGLWDDVNNESAAKILLDSESPHVAATLLRDLAFQRGSEDNISVIVVDLDLLRN